MWAEVFTVNLISYRWIRYIAYDVLFACNESYLVVLHKMFTNKNIVSKLTVADPEWKPGPPA
jgi:hypothetical protein